MCKINYLTLKPKYGKQIRLQTYQEMSVTHICESIIYIANINVFVSIYSYILKE